jgi:hypothetical protein
MTAISRMKPRPFCAHGLTACSVGPGVTREDQVGQGGVQFSELSALRQGPPSLLVHLESI